jgi:hypothetical protein
VNGSWSAPTKARALVVAAAAVIAIGLLAGFLPFSAKDEPCGSAFRPVDTFGADLADTWADASDIVDNAVAGSHQEACEDRGAQLRLGAIILIAIGSIGLSGLAVPKLAIPDPVDVG